MAADRHFGYFRVHWYFHHLIFDWYFVFLVFPQYVQCMPSLLLPRLFSEPHTAKISKKLEF
jgi:hypothetical protein